MFIPNFNNIYQCLNISKVVNSDVAGTTDKFTTTSCVKILSSFIIYTLCCQASDGVNAV